MSTGRAQLSSVPTMAFYFLSLGSSSQEKGFTSQQHLPPTDPDRFSKRYSDSVHRGWIKNSDVVAKLPPLCLYTLTASKQPLMTLENGLCYWNCVSTHQGHEAFPGQGRQWGQKKEKSGQKPDCTDSYWTKPLLPTLCITALKTNESRRQVERAEQHKLSSITVPQDTIKWIEKSSNIQTVLLPLSAISMFVLG